MKKNKEIEKHSAEDVEEELDNLLKLIARKKSAVKKIRKIIPQRNEKD
jgi:hypothetical protein